MIATQLYARLTHKYNAGWSHLDRHEHIGPFRMTEPRRASTNDEGDTVHISHGKLRRDLLVNARQVWRQHADRDNEGHRQPFKAWLEMAIAENFTAGCQCEHDCCGHWQRYALVDIEGRRVRVALKSYRNV